MKILFINPSLRLGSPSKFLPVGLGYIMTVVRDGGYDFDLLDIDLNNFENTYVEKYLRNHSYDVVLLGCIVTHFKWVKWCTRIIREHQPHCKIVVGNSVAGSIPELFLSKTPSDVVVMGEGEYSTLEVLNAFRDGNSLEGILGIAYRTNKREIKVNPRRPTGNVNDLPMIDWDLFDVQKYFDFSDSAAAVGIRDVKEKICTMPVVTARGCIARCTFCHFVFWNDPYRHRSSESILQECRRNIEKYQANYISFWDDLSFSSVNQAEKVVDEILASGLKFYWSAAVRTDLFGNPKISYEKRLRVAKKFKESGCLAVGFSLESGNEEILKMMEKKVEVKYFEEQVKLLQKVNIQTATSVVFGYPIETKDTIKETFEMCLKNNIYPSIGFLLPLPATGMYQYALDHGYIPDEEAYLDSITERQDVCLNMTKMSEEEILGEIKKWGMVLNRMLELNLTEDTLIKTGGYRKQEPKIALDQGVHLIDPENLKRNENDFNFNYSQQVFNLDSQIKKESN